LQAKWQGISLPVDAFEVALRDALEHISAFSLNNHEWRSIAALQKITPVPYQEWSAKRPQELIEEFRPSSEQYGS